MTSVMGLPKHQIGSFKWESAFEHAQNVQIQIILHMHPGLCSPLIHMQQTWVWLLSDVIDYNYFCISWLQITITITFEVNVINYNYFTKVIMITLWLLMITFPGNLISCWKIYQLCMYLLCMPYWGMNMNEKKYVVTSDLVFAIFISSSNCHTN